MATWPWLSAYGEGLGKNIKFILAVPPHPGPTTTAPSEAPTGGPTAGPTSGSTHDHQVRWHYGGVNTEVDCDFDSDSEYDCGGDDDKECNINNH